jgi:hypothetical protein
MQEMPLYRVVVQVGLTEAHSPLVTAQGAIDAIREAILKGSPAQAYDGQGRLVSFAQLQREAKRQQGG